MDLHLHVGDFVLEAEADGDAVSKKLIVRLHTPWFDSGFKTGYNRAASLQVCVSCGMTKQACECNNPVYMSAKEVAESLNVMHVNMVHHLMEDGDEEE